MAAPLLFSNYFANDDNFSTPRPDHATLQAVLGEGTAVNSPDVSRAIVNTAARSPITVAVVLQGDEDNIYVGHSPTFYPADLMNATVMDDQVVLLLGDEVSSCVTIVLDPATMGQRVPNTRCHNVAYLTGVNGHGAAPPVFRTGPHAAGANQTDVLHTRRVVVLPTSVTQTALTLGNSGQFTIVGFYNSIIQPEMAAGGDRAAAMAHVEDWWRVVSTTTNGANNAATPVRANAIALANPVQVRLLNAWVSRIRDQTSAALGRGGPGLTTAAFETGINDLRDAMNNNARAHLEFERTKNNKSFSERHGDALAQRMYYLTASGSDADLPEVHKLLAKSPKGMQYAILGQYLHDRAIASEVPLSANNVPLVTTKLMEEVFRRYNPSGTGMIFASGLSPFSMTSDGQNAIAELVKSKVHKASLTESGGTLSINDASTLTSTDVRLPTMPYDASVKLYCWSVVIDVFHGVAHPVALSIRRFVMSVGPLLHEIATFAGNSTVGMDWVLRVLFEAQQDYFSWATKMARGDVGAVVPDFERIIEAAGTFRTSRLSQLPDTWYTMLKQLTPPSDSGQGSSAAGSARQQSGTVATFNAHADEDLLKRYKDSGFNTISAMQDGKDAPVPKHAQKEVCLAWALKGNCSASCKRKEAHVKYSRDTIRKIHEMLDQCGVAAAQP